MAFRCGQRMPLRRLVRSTPTGKVGRSGRALCLKISSDTTALELAAARERKTTAPDTFLRGQTRTVDRPISRRSTTWDRLAVAARCGLGDAHRGPPGEETLCEAALLMYSSSVAAASLALY
jgi:hypothetical protein